MKKGSALLVVLGMMAFMVISAVAFSAYMRYSRLPSSYLRRTSASRHLAKAALAEAIDILDVSIGNDPYPGMGDDGSSYSYPRSTPTLGGTQDSRKRNYWRNHCFIGTNRLMDVDNTVSTLTLEGLAYLPPALINEARYYSRRSSAAVWRNLGFDSGRFAFSAVDVSDHLDINRVFADRGRSSADDGRITLAHVFEDADHTNPEGAVKPSDWDNFLANFDSTLPLVSLADLNLAIADRKSDWIASMSPFCNYVVNHGGDFISSVSSPEAELQRSMMFVTDSYFPSTNDATSAKYDLCCSQPFPQMRHERNQQYSYDDQMGGAMSSDILTLLTRCVTDLDTVSLYDYLDENDIPTSLALPSVERVPMICGLQPNATFHLKAELVPPTIPAATAGAAQFLTGNTAVPHEYKLTLQGGDATVGSRCLYPFRHDNESENGKSYSVEFALRIGFCVGNGPGRRGVANSAFSIGDEAEFMKSGVIENGVIKLYHKAQQSPKSSNVRSETDAYSQAGDGESFEGFSSLNNNVIATFTVPHKYELVVPSDGSAPRYDDKGPDDAAPPTIDTNGKVYPLNADGTGDGGFNVASLRNGTAVEVKPYMTLMARVKANQDGNKTVDLVPAAAADDMGFNQLKTEEFRNEVEVVCGAGRPFFTMVGSTSIKFTEADFTQGQDLQVDLTPTTSGGSYVCPDPRWNFAPDNFYVRNGTLPDANTFFQNCDFENNGRDCDPFMMVSNQGYMQSPSEFAFLPRTTNARLPVSGSQSGDARITLQDEFAASEGTAPYDKLGHGHLMWKTYRLFAQGDADADDIYGFGLKSDGSGFRVNPYAASRRTIMAALANTPVSWWAASTNFNNNASGKPNLDGLGAADFNKKYAFNQMNGDAKLYWKDLEKVADAILGQMRAQKDGNWQRTFNELDWDYEDGICGVKFDQTNPDDFYDVDRKMLYGFWRDSFAVKQQLFLIFVRAEPMMMGGGAIGQTPPQLGARAVALVWRDPRATTRDAGGDQPRPHRTRILFYRQFD